MVAIVTRRRLLAGAALGAVPLALLDPTEVLAAKRKGKRAAKRRTGRLADVAPLVRHNVSTPEGAAMLAKYKTAVAAMVAKSKDDPGHPCGWTFQWYTHAIRSDTTKAAAIAALPAAQRPFATEMWNTCQAHGATTPGAVEDYFLPWHRMYVYYLERIVRETLGDQTFTLPYWDYVDSATRSIPLPFRDPGNTTNALYRKDRNSGAGGLPKINDGDPIDKGMPSSFINLDALKEPTYSGVGVAPGFNRKLDSELHGNVHGRIGNTVGMGRVPWAANDPIFWMHHCNIDRIWASWNKAGYANPTDPTWLSKQFIFADEKCNRVVATIGDFKDIAQLNYTYDKFEPAPPPPTGRLSRGDMIRLAAVRTVRLPVGPGPLHVKLRVDPTIDQTLRQRLATVPKAQRLYLVIGGLRATQDPGVIYGVYLGARPDANRLSSDAVPVGAINFFDAIGHEDMPMPDEGVGGKFQSFDVTDSLRKLQRDNRMSEELNVTIVPIGEADPKAAPEIGRIELVQQ